MISENCFGILCLNLYPRGTSILEAKQTTVSILLEHLKERDQVAFKQLFTQHKQKLFAYCCKITKSEEAAEEIVQRTEENTDELNTPRATPKALWTQVKADLEDAAAKLPWEWDDAQVPQINNNEAMSQEDQNSGYN